MNYLEKGLNSILVPIFILADIESRSQRLYKVRHEYTLLQNGRWAVGVLQNDTQYV